MHHMYSRSLTTRQEYINAVTISTECRESEVEEFRVDNYKADMRKEKYFFPQTREVYICPRRIQVHRGRKDKCGNACQKAQEGAKMEFEKEVYFAAIVVEKKILFDEKTCRLE